MSDERLVLQVRLWQGARRAWEDAEASALGHASSYCTALTRLRTQWQTVRSPQQEQHEPTPEDAAFMKAMDARDFLSAHLKKLEGILEKMRAIASNLQREMDRQQTTPSSTPLRRANKPSSTSRLPPCDLASHMSALVALHDKELQLKHTLLADMGTAPARTHQLVCLSAWLEQPFLAIDGQHHLEAISQWFAIVSDRS
ncbi:hypothetical protein PTSG_04112 [Salpingoeca rosetta]|uniref:Uncharacterized protein n=1 Tax=Salpingoeca rosetta (strain ATCC 50818 / BSB-021) TaxID=946362 RepID=F2U6M2_SALR5|nr:uncharacterized protein PTSG_04112 [Salpingoeca rosetta]EGD83504.1 hypothetical protein PTSG_04112 [Salpingoeca rosetta]|eukprot:XP_004995008.1 hypothetical protein PTSG_04112 [Salpingoeca rosetta]